MSNRVFNFYAGPATLPLPVMKEAQEEFLNFQGNGMSVMEMSHRHKDFENLVLEAESLVKELLGFGDSHRVLFLQGGASLQFAMLPLNFLAPDKTADYILTGSFAEKAWKEARLTGNIHLPASTKEENYRRIPDQKELNFSSSPVYAHMTTNNTIYGTQWSYTPQTEHPLVADMSSDILSCPFDVSGFGLIYAGAQKNLGPAGVTLVIIRQDFLEKVPTSLPSMLRYDIHANNNSLYNTPSSFSVYMLNKVLHWLKNQGGLAQIQKRNIRKAAYLYNAIDKYTDFYQGHAEKGSRSLMNVTFRLPTEAVEKLFLTEATQHQMVGLKGHRSVGGIRASIYNAMPEEGCQALATFMQDFCKRHG